MSDSSNSGSSGCGCLALLVFTFLALISGDPCADILILIGLIFIFFG